MLTYYVLTYYLVQRLPSLLMPLQSGRVHHDHTRAGRRGSGLGRLSALSTRPHAPAHDPRTLLPRVTARECRPSALGAGFDHPQHPPEKWLPTTS